MCKFSAILLVFEKNHKHDYHVYSRACMIQLVFPTLDCIFPCFVRSFESLTSLILFRHHVSKMQAPTAKARAKPSQLCTCAATSPPKPCTPWPSPTLTSGTTISTA